MRGWIKRLTAITAVSLILCASTACDGHTWEDLEIVGEPTMTVQSFDEETGLYTVIVEGLAKNTTGEVCDYASIHINFFDELGDPITYNTYTIDYMGADETWRFCIKSTMTELSADCEVSGSCRYQ